MPKRNDIQLPVTYIEQSTRSVNCGPCSLQMLLTYHGITNCQGEAFSTQSLNRLLGSTRKYGAQEQDMEEFFMRYQIPFKHLSFGQIIPHLKQQRPVLTAFEDEMFDGHFALIIGADYPTSSNPTLIFHDPWPDFGPYFRRTFKDFKRQASTFGPWLITLAG